MLGHMETWYGRARARCGYCLDIAMRSEEIAVQRGRWNQGGASRSYTHQDVNDSWQSRARPWRRRVVGENIRDRGEGSLCEAAVAGMWSARKKTESTWCHRGLRCGHFQEKAPVHTQAFWPDYDLSRKCPNSILQATNKNIKPITINKANFFICLILLE